MREYCKRGLDYRVVRKRFDTHPYMMMQHSSTKNDTIVAYEYLFDLITETFGCYYIINDKELMIELIADAIGIADLKYAEECLNNIIRSKGFNQEIYNRHNILTNKELLEDFVYATQRRKARFIKNCCLLTAEEINDLSDGHVHELDEFTDIDGNIVNILPYIVNKETQSNSNS